MPGRERKRGHPPSRSSQRAARGATHREAIAGHSSTIESRSTGRKGPRPAIVFYLENNRMTLARFKHGLAIVVVAAVVFSVGFLARRSGNTGAKAASHEEATAPAAHPDDQPALAHVEVIHPKAGGMERFTTQPGTVQAFEHEEIFAKTSGYLINQKVDIGSRVHKNDLLAEIYAPELKEAVKEADAAVQQANARVAQMEAAVKAAQAEVEAAKAYVDLRTAEVKAASSNLKYREKQYKRYVELAKSGSIDERLMDEKFDQFESAQSRFDAAQAAIKTAEADVRTKEAKRKQADADLGAAKASLAVAEAALGKAKVMDSYTEIRSHYDGVITTRGFHNGDFIQDKERGGNIPLLTVQRTDKMRVIVKVPDSDVPFVDEGDPAELVIDNLPDVQFKGYKVSRVSGSEDANSRTMQVEIDVPNKFNGKELLRDGMYGKVTIHLEQPLKTAVTLPANCIVHDELTGKTSVYVVRDNKAVLVPVKLGQDNAKDVEVVSGLKVDDQVVYEHSGALVNGQAVVVDSSSALARQRGR
jgi:RND family efflux transporter MFP subunit